MTKKIFYLVVVILQFAFLQKVNCMTAGEGVDVFLTHANILNGYTDRSQSISADITGHVLTITFNDNVGIAHIVIKDSNGVYFDRENVFSTPDHATFIIDDAGSIGLRIDCGQ